MSGKIELLKISQSKTEYGCKVDFDIKINSNPYTLWYKIHCRDIESIPERSDSFAVTFLPFAMLNNLDLCSEYPMSTELYHNITTEIIPQLYVCNKKISSKINLHIPCTSETYNSDWNATGVSLGVDSFATIHEFQEGHLNDDFKLTHLVHLKTGAQSGSKGYFDREYEDRVFASENTRVRNFCDKYNYNLITIESNLFEITCAEFTAAFATSSTTRNLGAIMLLQHRIKRYYYAASYNIDDFSTHLDKDMAHYEK